MLKIRQEQMDAFRDQRKQGFEDAVVDRISSQTQMSPGDVRTWVQARIPLALRAGFLKESELMRLLLAQYSLRDDLSGSVQQTMEDHDLTPELKLALLEQEVARQ